MQFKFWATTLQSWLNQIDKANNDFKQNKLCMCSVLCSIGSVLNANCKIHCFGEPAIYFPKSFLRRNFHLNPTFSSPPRLFSHKYSFNEVVFEYRNHRRPTFPLFSFLFYLNSFLKKQSPNCFTFQSSHSSSHPRPLPSPNWRTFIALDSLFNLSENQHCRTLRSF